MFGQFGRLMLDEGAGGGSGGAGGSGGSGGGQQQEPVTFEAWLEKQPEDVKGLLDGHTKGLKSALASERERSKGMEKELREAASKLEKGSEAEKKLLEMADQAAQANRKAGFYEQAVAAGVSNIKLAFVAAQNDDLFKKDGSADFEELKKNYPELFAVRSSNNGGSGTGGQPGPKTNMDDFIRGKAGIAS